MSAGNLSDLDLRVLGVLPDNNGPGRWPTSAEVERRLGLGAGVGVSVLGRLRGRGLVEDDGERPMRFARTAFAAVELEFGAA